MKNLNLNLNSRLTDANNITISSQKALKTYIDSKRILLNFLQNSAPTTFQTGNTWLNTSNLKLYTATSSSSWDSGINITTNELYTFNNVLYHYDGTNLTIYSTDSIKEQNSGDETKIWIGTQSEYDNLDSHDENTLYNIIDTTSVVSALLATQQEFNNSAQNRAATPYQVNQKIGNYMPLAGGNFDIGAVVRFTNGNGTNSISYDSNNILNITNNVSVSNNLTANNIVATSGNIYKTNTSGANVIWSSDKGVANGLATLDSNTKVPTTQLPLATNSTVGVVQGDGTTTSVNANGVISVIGGGGGTSDYHPPLLSSIWSDHLLNDVQWLRADTFSWQSGETYSSVYQHLLDDIGYIRYMIPNDDIQEKFYRSPSDDTTMFAWTNQYSTLYTESEFPENGDDFYYHDQVFGTVLSTGTEAGSSAVTPTTETIGGYTITYYLADDKHKIVLADQENNVSTIYASTGVAWYFILDTTNTRFKLPRSTHGHGQLVSSKVTEDSWCRIYQDGWCEQGGKTSTRGSDSWQTINLLKPFSNTNYTVLQANITGYGQNESGVVNDITTSSFKIFAWAARASFWEAKGYISTPLDPFAPQYKYLYFYVGNFSQSATEQTAGLNSELFNAKVDLDGSNATFPHIVETYSNGTDWYRVWSDGWCEQGGRYAVVSSSPHTINLFKTMSNTDYFIMICPALNNAGDYTVSILVRTDMITANSFGIQKQWTSSSGYYYWKTEGYIS